MVTSDCNLYTHRNTNNHDYLKAECPEAKSKIGKSEVLKEEHLAGQNDMLYYNK
jgi:hypothetical protein